MSTAVVFPVSPAPEAAGTGCAAGGKAAFSGSFEGSFDAGWRAGDDFPFAASGGAPPGGGIFFGDTLPAAGKVSDAGGPCAAGILDGDFFARVDDGGALADAFATGSTAAGAFGLGLFFPEAAAGSGELFAEGEGDFFAGSATAAFDTGAAGGSFPTGVDAFAGLFLPGSGLVDCPGLFLPPAEAEAGADGEGCRDVGTGAFGGSFRGAERSIFTCLC